MIRWPRIAFVTALLAVVAGTHAADAITQTTQPVYVQYDGFVRVKSAGGGYVLAFGYFNLGDADITVAPGSGNAFAPGPPDRNQPSLFRKGRHRFSCVMVVGPSFSGPLQWTLTASGKTTTTTKLVLDPLYELELNSERRVLRGLDLTSAPANVCVNRAPVPEVAASALEPPSPERVELEAHVGQEFRINARIEDDGLPRGGQIRSNWRKVSGPGDVAFVDPSTPAARVRFGAAGAYELELAATDGQKSASLRIGVRVSP